MSVWRDMVIDGGLHIDAGVSIEEAAAWVEAQEQERYQKWLDEQAAEEARLESLNADPPKEEER